MDRRKLLALGGLGGIGASTGEFGPEADPNYGGSLTIRIQRTMYDSEWTVLVPDLEHKWLPGRYMPPVKWMPLSEFLAELDKLTYGS